MNMVLQPLVEIKNTKKQVDERACNQQDRYRSKERQRYSIETQAITIFRRTIHLLQSFSYAGNDPAQANLSKVRL